MVHPTDFENSWSAIITGALMKALITISPTPGEEKDNGRIARRHNGLIVEAPFDEERTAEAQLSEVL